MVKVFRPVVALLVLVSCDLDGGVYDDLDPKGSYDHDGDAEVREGACRSQGYWKTHGDAWPAHALYLGDETYERAELLDVMRTPAKGNASLILAYQLVAAKLNVKVSGNLHGVKDVVDAADRALEGRGRLRTFTVPSTGAPGEAMVELARKLEIFNTTEGCGDPYGGSGGGGEGEPEPEVPTTSVDVRGTCEGPYGCDRVEIQVHHTDRAVPANDLFVHRLTLQGDGPWRFGSVEGVWSDGYEARWADDLPTDGALVLELKALDVVDTQAPIHLRLGMATHGQPDELGRITVTVLGSTAPLDQAHELVEHVAPVTPY